MHEHVDSPCRCPTHSAPLETEREIMDEVELVIERDKPDRPEKNGDMEGQ